MKGRTHVIARWAATTAVLLLAGLTGEARATIDGVTGTNFHFRATADYIVTPDGNSLLIWGYANGAGRAQYPGPTLIVQQGAALTIELVNELDTPVSIVFPGQDDVVATGGVAGAITREAAAAGATGPLGEPLDRVTYSFVATHPGTYHYHSGTRPDLQVEMGLLGALIVRPTGAASQAYNHADSRYDHEYLFLLSEMDVNIHNYIEFGLGDQVDNTAWWPVYWFINGRNAPDTMAEANIPTMPTQPYNCMPRMHPGDRLLMRVINAGRDIHPFHHHGNHARIIAKDGRLLESASGAGADLSFEVFTVQSVPGETVDAIFTWTGEKLGWDMYGHAASDPLQPHEYAPDHGKPFPLILPDFLNLTFGGWWGGSPFMGQLLPLPPGQGGLNINGGYYHMWHSHTEREMVNFDIFPGGMMTMLAVEPPGVPIP
jgi:hypothetical protein